MSGFSGERGFVSLHLSLICTVNWLVLRVFADRAFGLSSQS
jgi:hypothetical protein